MTPPVSVETLPFDTSSQSSIETQVNRLAASDVRVVMFVGTEDGLPSVLASAYKLNLLTNSMWVFSDGVSAETIGGAPGTKDMPAGMPADAMNGAIRVVAAGGTDSNPRWVEYAANFANADFDAINAFVPAQWQSAFATYYSNSRTRGRTPRPPSNGPSATRLETRMP